MRANDHRVPAYGINLAIMVISLTFAISQMSVEGPMASTYEAFEFDVRLGYPGGSTLHLRVHAPDRARAWERVQQMHPRAVEAMTVKAKKCEEVHNFRRERQNLSK